MSEAALREAIVTEPDEDLPRLAYADWLDEHDRGEEAEFIRVQCRLARHPYDAPDYPILLERPDDLAEVLDSAGRAGLPKLPAGLGFSPYIPDDLPSRRHDEFARGFLDRTCYQKSWAHTPRDV